MVVVNLILIIFSTNVVCIIFRILKFIEFKSKRPITLLTLFLHVSDGIAGFYLVTLAIIHVYYEGWYLQVSQVWISSLLCRMIGGVIWLSIQLSSITVFSISLNKMYLVWKPFQRPPMKMKHFLSLCSVITLVIVLQIILQTQFELLNQDKFCLWINVNFVQNPATMIYSCFVMLEVVSNMLCMIGVFILNMTAVYLARKSCLDARREKTKSDIAFARQTIIMAFTCLPPWSVMLLFSTLCLSGYNTDSRVMAWLVVGGVSVSPVINPVLYTLSTRQYREWFSNK